MNKNLIKALGVVAAVGGLALNLLSGWVSDQKMKETIKEMVDEAVAEKN